MANVLTEQQVQEILDDAIDEIKSKVIEQTVNSSVWTVKQAISIRIDEVIQTFVEEEIKPQLLVALDDRKSEIISAAILGAENMAVELAKVMSKALAENLACDYKRGDILKAMFL